MSRKCAEVCLTKEKALIRAPLRAWYDEHPGCRAGEMAVVIESSECRTSRYPCIHYTGNVGSSPRLVSVNTALYHTCFIRGQGCNWRSQRPNLTSSVISDVKPIIYFVTFTLLSLEKNGKMRASVAALVRGAFHLKFKKSTYQEDFLHLQEWHSITVDSKVLTSC